MRNWDLPRSAVGVRHLLVEAVTRGADERACLAGTTLTRDVVERANATVTAWQELTVAGNVATLLQGEPGLGLALGRRAHVAAYGAVGIAALSSADLVAALALSRRYAGLMPALSRIDGQRVGTLLGIRLDGSRLPEPARALLVERDLVTAVTAVRELTGVRAPAVKVEVSFPAEPTTEWIEFFGAPPIRADRTRCLLDGLHPNAPLPQADPFTAASALDDCARVLAERRRTSTVVDQVLDQLWRSAPRLPSLEELAGGLFTTTRTLRRRLAAEGTSFRELTNQVRMVMATQLIEAGRHSVQQVAHQLGYGDTSAFTHAFRRWTGTSPREFREREVYRPPSR